LSAFSDYARYYDVLYRGKDYKSEAEYVTGILRRFAPDAKTVLDVGCGTGAYASKLAEAGYSIHGVDLSQAMLDRAEVMRSSLPDELAGRLTFSRGDARSLDLGEKYDAIVSLFHVMSYQTSNEDLLSAFAAARAHLAPGGVFIFDCWYGPAVLTDRPRIVRKQFADGDVILDRLSEPEMDAERNVVHVHYTLSVTDGDALAETVRERHDMRYLFTPEVELMLATNGLELTESREWMSDKAPGFDSWNVCYVALG
jgi:SAM-dependent methyltransferase